MSRLLSLGLVMIFLLIFLASGCIEKQEQEAEQVEQVAVNNQTTPTQEIEVKTKTDCDDKNPCTEDIFNELTGECEHNLIENCCGNGICEVGERCNEETHLTNCVEDCSRTCPAFLIVHKGLEGNESEIFAMTCDTVNCKQTDENRYEITDNARLKLTITNLGEITSSKVYSDFMCWSGDLEATDDGEEIHGVIFEDYFNNFQDELRGINPIQTGDNSANYYLSFNVTNIEQSFTANCKVFIKSTDFRNEQKFTISFVG